MRYLLLAALSLAVTGSQAQVILGDAINDGILPADDEPICDIPIYPEMLAYTHVMSEDSIVPDFTLFDLDGTAYHLADIMADGKPVVLFGCSYTCYVYRGKVPSINSMVDYFGEDVNFFLVNTVEAHPFGDVSPYFGYEYPGDENIADGVLYPQPTTYGERKAIATDMVANMDLPDIPVLLDDPCNNFWTHFGAFPIPAILINTDGTVYDYHEWLNNYPDNLMASLYTLLDGGIIEDPTPDGTFEMGVYTEECMSGEPGSTIVHHIELINTDTVDAYIGVDRTAEWIPDGWEISLCTDICYPPDVLTTNIYVEAGDTAAFSLYFFTDEMPGEGQTDLYIHQMFNPDINYTITLKACTEEVADTTTAILQAGAASWSVFPNPASGPFTVTVPFMTGNDIIVSMYDLQGNEVFAATTKGQQPLTLNTGLPPGNYILRLASADRQISTLITLQ